MFLFFKGSNSQSSPSRQIKQTLPTLYNDETMGNVQEEKRRQKEQLKIKKLHEYEERKYVKQKENSENNKSNEIHQKEQGRIKSKYVNIEYFTFSYHSVL